MIRILLLSPERIRPVMAGVGIRFAQITRYLNSLPDIEVELAIPNEPDPSLADELRLIRYDQHNLAALVAKADVVFVHAHVSNLYFAAIEARRRKPLIVDLYDPFPIENLNYFPSLGDEPYRHDRSTLERQLEEGDFFLCSSQEQRLFYLGMLFGLGRLNPETYFDDFALENLVRIVPFGLPATVPEARGPLLRNVVEGIGSDDPIIFFGGIYDWYDAELLVEALPELLVDFGNIRIVFSANPNPESTPQGTYGAMLDRCRTRGWLDRHVFFVPWVPFERRSDLYREASLGAVLHHPRFETELSMRTRVQDFLWAGLPTIATAGGGMSRLLEEHQMGIVIPHHDRRALVAAISTLLESENQRNELVARGQAWAAENTWPRVLAPLIDFVRSPRIDPHKTRYRGARSAKPARQTLLQRTARKLKG